MQGIIIQLLKKDILSYVTAWTTLEDAVLSKINRPHRDKYCMTPVLPSRQKAESWSPGAGAGEMDTCCSMGIQTRLHKTRTL